jgi:hypothetical protein
MDEDRGGSIEGVWQGWDGRYNGSSLPQTELGLIVMLSESPLQLLRNRKSN